MSKTIFQLVEQDAAEQEKEGIGYKQLIQMWKQAGEPREPQAIVNFLKKHAKFTPEQTAEVFKAIGIDIQAAYGQGGVSLSQDSVEKIQKYLATLDVQQLNMLAKSVKATKPKTGAEQQSAKALGGAG